MKERTVKWITVPIIKGTQQILVDDYFDPRVLDGYVFEIQKNKGLSVYSLNNQLRTNGEVAGSVNEIFGKSKRSKRTNSIDKFDYTSGAWSKKGTPRYIDCSIDSQKVIKVEVSKKLNIISKIKNIFKRFTL